MTQIDVECESTGTVWKILCSAGDSVREDDDLLIVESMKMEIPVPAPCDGTVREIRVVEGSAVSEGEIVAVMECP